MSDFNKLDLFTVKVFLELYEKKTGLATAKSLQTTQPKISRSLNTLRETFNDPLFNRLQYGFEPNAKADRLYPKIRKIVEDFEELEQLVSGIDNTNEALNICIQEQYSEALIRAIQFSYGDDISVVTHPWSLEVEEHISKLEIDYSLSINPEPCRGMVDYKIASVSRYFLVARKGHPLFSEPFSMANFIKYPVARFVFPTTRSKLSSLEKYVDDNNLNMNVAMRTSSAATLLLQLKSSNCVAVTAGMPMLAMVLEDPELQLYEVTEYWKSTVLSRLKGYQVGCYLRAKEGMPEERCQLIVQSLRAFFTKTDARCSEVLSSSA